MREVILSLFSCLLILPNNSIGQAVKDTTRQHESGVVVIEDLAPAAELSYRFPDSLLYLLSGKKGEVIFLDRLPTNVTDKIARQLFAKVPGVFVYDMDGAGNQLNIGIRGLDPHRGWELNMRKDGIVTNSDMYGYPASHYSIPMESVERIEMVRGTGAIQYGAQFGGMLNMVTKAPDTTRAIAIEQINTRGSFGLYSSYTAASGRIGRLDYGVYYTKRTREGYRQQEQSEYDAQNLLLRYRHSSRLTMQVEYSRSYYSFTSPGPLNDSMFKADPRQATRRRNYYSPTIHILTASARWKPSAASDMEFSVSRLTGERNSVLFNRPATVADIADTLTGFFGGRSVDIDLFHSYTIEWKHRYRFSLAGKKHQLVHGIQAMNNRLTRRQQGRAVDIYAFDLDIDGTGWGRDLLLHSKNLAYFIESQFSLAPRFTVNAGLRWEVGNSKNSGTMRTRPGDDLSLVIERNFLIAGASFSYQTDIRGEVYGGFSQSYRPLLLRDLTPTDAFEEVDPSMRDASGYTAEAGWRGRSGRWQWDVSAFSMRYNNRPGVVRLETDSAALRTFRTNIGDAMTNGMELMVNTDVVKTSSSMLSVFLSGSYMRGIYIRGAIVSAGTNVDLTNKEIEGVPRWMARSGVTLRKGAATFAVLHSFVAQHYSDALNTAMPAKDGSVGPIPAYQVVDVNITLAISESVQLRFGLNNALDQPYFTKRPLIYPGPGVWPSDGRNGYFTVALKLK
jgi:Fe(3+) dicitrate transport protein